MNRQYGLTTENLMRTLPAALRRDPKMIALGEAIADVLAQRWTEMEALNIYGHMDSLPEGMLDILAHDFKVDWYDCDYPSEAKSQLLKTARYVHRHLGTTGAIRQFMQAVYTGADIEEWFSYGGEPHHFRLTLHLQNVISDDALRRVVRSCRLVKRLSSWIDDIRITLPEVAGAAHMGGRFVANTRLGAAERADVFDYRSAVYAGGRMAAHMELGAAEQPDVFDARGTVYAGGQFGAQAFLESREELAAPEVTGTVRAGGCLEAVARVGGDAARERGTRAGLQLRPRGCAYTILPGHVKGEG